MTGHLKDNLFCVDCIAGWSLGACPRPFWDQNWPKNLIVLRFTYITHLFGLSQTRLNAIITNVLYLTVLHGIALLVSARRLYFARHLSTL